MNDNKKIITPIHNIEAALSRELQSSQKTAFLCIGSELMCDDACGMNLGKILLASNADKKSIKIILGSTAPENFTGEIIKYNPDTVVIIDAAQMGLPPGSISILDPSKITGISFSTHMMPLNILINFIDAYIKTKFIILAIEPESVEFKMEMSETVEQSVTYLAKILNSILK